MRSIECLWPLWLSNVMADERCEGCSPVQVDFLELEPWLLLMEWGFVDMQVLVKWAASYVLLTILRFANLNLGKLAGTACELY